ncbi:MAG: hypothetical protein NTY13_02615 [Chlamydiae bacterium]|nr:hypothetical protein [Chlamydiota bacterium]
MTATMIDKLRNFRSNLFARITFRADSTRDLIDAVAGQATKESIEKLS